MIPRRVTLRNFLSFGDDEQVIDFTENESLWILTGPNGVGKSAVFDAITYCLFAEHRGGKSDSKNLIRHGAPALRVSFEFSFDGAIYRITRTRGTNATQRVEQKSGEDWSPVPGVNGVTETNAWVTGTLGLAYEAFTKSVLLRQGESDAIILAKGTERFEMLKRIIDIARFEKLSARIADAMKEHQAELKSLQQRRGNAVEVKPEEMDAAKIALEESETARLAAQAAVLEAGKAVEQAKQYEALASESRELDAKLVDADARAKQRKQIEADHARLHELNAVLPKLKDIASAAERLRTAESKRAADAEALAKLNETLTADAASLEVARTKAAEHHASKEKHEREVERLRAEIPREKQCLATAENVARLAEQLKQHAPDLDERLDAARESLQAADAAGDAAATAKGEADSRLKHLRQRQKDFKSVGATCSMCGQAVTEKHAAEEKAKLTRETAAAEKQSADAELAAATARSLKQKAKADVDSLAEEVKQRDEAKAAFTSQKAMLEGLKVASDPAELRAALAAKRAAVADLTSKAAADSSAAKASTDAAKSLEAKLKKATAERDALVARLQSVDAESVAARTLRDTLLGQLAPEWHGAVDLAALSAEQADLEKSGIAARFAALQSDSDNQQSWKARRDAIRAELDKLPATSLTDAQAASTEASARFAQASAARDAARSSLDGLERAVAEFGQLIAAVNEAETAFERHRKLNLWLGKEGLLRELVREAEREIVHHAQDTLRNLSSGDLELELQPPEEGKDEALVLLVRRAGDPEPIPVRFLSGSQKFRVAVAVAVAIGRFAAGPAAAKPLESVIIDEGFGSLDKDGLAAMRDELENLKNSQALQRVILVSHQEEFTKSFPVGYRLLPGETGTVATRFRNEG
jgi:DNA repair exonuclease SbcCD ATPase subunit